jgi:hypothetical protein
MRLAQNGSVIVEGRPTLATLVQIATAFAQPMTTSRWPGHTALARKWPASYPFESCGLSMQAAAPQPLGGAKRAFRLN